MGSRAWDTLFLGHLGQSLMEKRRPSQGDVTDEEWGFVAPYLTLMKEDSPQRQYELRELSSALQLAGPRRCAVAIIAEQFPPGKAVCQQTQRWFRAGCFESMTDDLCSIMRVVQVRQDQSGAHASVHMRERSVRRIHGYKRKRGSKTLISVDTLGHLLSVYIPPADKQKHAQLQGPVQQVQRATDKTVKLAFADQGYIGKDAAVVTSAEGIEPQVIKLPEAKKGLVLGWSNAASAGLMFLQAGA